MCSTAWACGVGSIAAGARWSLYRCLCASHNLKIAQQHAFYACIKRLASLGLHVTDGWHAPYGEGEEEDINVLSTLEKLQHVSISPSTEVITPLRMLTKLPMLESVHLKDPIILEGLKSADMGPWHHLIRHGLDFHMGPCNGLTTVEYVSKTDLLHFTPDNVRDMRAYLDLFCLTELSNEVGSDGSDVHLSFIGSPFEHCVAMDCAYRMPNIHSIQVQADMTISEWHRLLHEFWPDVGCVCGAEMKFAVSMTDLNAHPYRNLLAQLGNRLWECEGEVP